MNGLMQRNKTCVKSSLFDHLVGGREQVWRHRETKLFGSLEVDKQLMSVRAKGVQGWANPPVYPARLLKPRQEAPMRRGGARK
jgi:hypothetical protein